MQQPLNNVDLRPLGIGEILDRSVTLAVRNWVPLAIVTALMALPAIALDVLGFASASRLPSSFFASIGFLACTGVIVQVYEAQTVDVRAALKRAASKILPMIGVNFLLVLTALVPFLAALLLTVWVYAAAQPLGSVLAAVLAAPFAILLIAVICVFYFLQFVMLATLTIEGAGVNEAFTRGLSIVFGGGGFWRGFAAACSVAGVMFAGYVSGAVSLTMLLGRRSALAQGITSLLLEIVMSLAAVIVTVYCFDMRVRRRGYDIERALDAAAPVRP